MPALPYSKNDAVARHQYDPNHPQAYMYEFAPTGGPWIGPRPAVVRLHGGGFANNDKDLYSHRYPDDPMVKATTQLDAYRAAGFTVFDAEYPLAHHPSNDDNEQVFATSWPETYLVAARLVQYLKDEMAATIRGNEIVLSGNSAGSLVASFIALTPSSWGMFPFLPGYGVSLDHRTPRSNARPRAVVLEGNPYSFRQMDPSRTKSGSPAALTTLLQPAFMARPLVRLTGTVTGTIAVGNKLMLLGDPTKWGVVTAFTPGSPATLEMRVQLGAYSSFPTSSTLEIYWVSPAGPTGNQIGPLSASVVLDHHGFSEIPLRNQLSIGPQSLARLVPYSDDELEELRTTVWYQTWPQNPSVQPKADFDPLEVVPGLYGVDDSAFALEAGADLTALGITHFLRWGVQASSNGLLEGQITGASNPGLIEITTAGNHFLATGDVIDIAGVLGNTAANGTARVVTVTALNKFTINGSSASGAYTSGGRWAFHNASGLYDLGGSALATDAIAWLAANAGIVP